MGFTNMHFMNEQRAESTRPAIDKFAFDNYMGRTFTEEANRGYQDHLDINQTDAPDILADLICNLLHLAEGYNMDPNKLLEQGRKAYEYESGDDYDGQ